MRRRRQLRRYEIYLQPEPEGGYTVIVPSLPGCITYGRDVSHARKMAADAIRLYLSVDAAERRWTPPSGGLLTAVDVAA